MQKFTFTSTDSDDERMKLDMLASFLKKHTDWLTWREEWQYLKELSLWQVIIEIEDISNG